LQFFFKTLGEVIKSEKDVKPDLAKSYHNDILDIKWQEILYLTLGDLKKEFDAFKVKNSYAPEGIDQDIQLQRVEEFLTFDNTDNPTEKQKELQKTAD